MNKAWAVFDPEDDDLACRELLTEEDALATAYDMHLESGGRIFYRAKCIRWELDDEQA